MKLRDLLIQGAQALDTSVPQPELEAEVLLAHILGQTRAYLYGYPDSPISEHALSGFMSCIKRRLSNEPVAYITGKSEFWSLPINVSSATLIPRPETELLVELTLALFPDRETVARIADLGTGSGAIALALASERPRFQINATDVSESALAIASNNAHQLGLNGVSFHEGNWFTALPADALSTGYDAIISNPPYIGESEWPLYADGLAYEPHHALVSGESGLCALAIIIQQASTWLKPGGYLLVEHGYQQGSEVRELFRKSGWCAVATHKDLSGQERVTCGSHSR